MKSDQCGVVALAVDDEPVLDDGTVPFSLLFEDPLGSQGAEPLLSDGGGSLGDRCPRDEGDGRESVRGLEWDVLYTFSVRKLKPIEVAPSTVDALFRLHLLHREKGVLEVRNAAHVGKCERNRQAFAVTGYDG